MDRLKQILGYDWLQERERWIPAVLFKERNIDVFYFVSHKAVLKNDVISVF